ncbi:MAG: replication-associated recombination protein A [Phycisphaerales bacterium]|nr:replication-associated recombination protein A [Planctomycetota bacterium]MCH8509910.1 replication-associated recombination protein A [Phycisphaerales bacterium]
MSDLWSGRRVEAVRKAEPLAVRVRPVDLDEVIGQTHLLGPGKLLRRMIDADAITSLILHGPPGTGKTTLAGVIAGRTKRRFVRENAASVGVKRIREIIDEAERVLGDEGKRTILFLDEIHRFTKAQQDVLLGDVERGLITLIGATTENPLFSVNSALISRSTLFRLEPLSEDETADLVRRAIAHPKGYKDIPIEINEGALRVWAVKSEGDGRRALGALEVAVESVLGEQRRGDGGGEAGWKPAPPSVVIDERVAEDSIQQKVAVYGDDGHYDAISAMIKSVRGSDPDAAVYWIARMLDAGEDPRFVARRLAILASEDIGNADPRGIMVAQACWDLVERIGMPEARITLSQCACYLALAPKSNAAYMAINAAMDDVKNGRVLPVPMYLRDPNSSPVSIGAGKGVRVKKVGGEGYEYSHDAEGQVSGQDYLGVEKRYYEPKDIGAEAAMRQRLEDIRGKRRERYGAGSGDGA